MGGAHHALWYMLSPVRHRSLACSEISGGLASDVVKDAPKAAKALPASLERDLRNGQVGVAEQSNGSLDTTCEQVTVRRDAESVFERAREVCLRDSAHLRQPVNGPFLMGRAIHSIFSAQQSSQ